MKARAKGWLHAANRDINWRIREDLRELGKELEGDALDLGCGSKPYADLFPKLRSYRGVDLPANRSANSLEKRADAYADLRALPFPDGSFDVVISTQVLEHMPDPEAVLAEAARLLRDDGILLLTIPFVAAEHEVPHDYFRFTRFGAEALLARAGFDHVRVRKQFGFWPTIADMFYWHVHRRVRGTWFEKYWFAFSATLLCRFFHMLHRFDPDEDIALNLCVLARKRAIANKRATSVPERAGVAVF